MRVIAGELKGRRLVQPSAATTRAATDRVRESLFAMLDPVVVGSRVLDLFAGAGSLGIEALSRGAARATFVDKDRAAVAAIRRNVAALGLGGRATVVAADVLRHLAAGGGGPYDLVFCDPPFAAQELLSATLAHEGLPRALAAEALVVARVLRKHPPAVPAAARVEREKAIGEETLLFLRYDAASR
ncbi:MAG: 16S rRNA (guanine(966)-N(2))-methyltransferase RsmD [Chloroflexi bacterium]|nr:16S rRNA (guanine(966)-N(2))-methyltransferase RsmD [Chloroflexota bacterium]